MEAEVEAEELPGSIESMSLADGSNHSVPFHVSALEQSQPLVQTRYNQGAAQSSIIFSERVEIKIPDERTILLAGSSAIREKANVPLHGLNFDLAKVKPLHLQQLTQSIKVSIPINTSQNLRPGSCTWTGYDASEGSKTRKRVHLSYCRHSLRLARQQTLCKVGMKCHWTEDKKLLSATRDGNIDEVSQLLKSGMSANTTDNKRRTALHVASSRGHNAIVRLLLDMRADPNRQDSLGNSPLHLAVCRGDLQTVKILSENGANVHMMDNAGRTPLSLVKARLNTLRKDRSISTDKLKREFLLLWDFLKFHSDPRQTVDTVQDLCHMMESVSTREDVDKVADAMIDQMSGLFIDTRRVT